MQLEISQAGKIIETRSLEHRNYSIGRDQENDIFLNDKGVSRNHARLEVTEDAKIVVVDLNSTNGTWIENSKIQSANWSYASTSLVIGGCQLRVRDVRKNVPHKMLPQLPSAHLPLHSQLQPGNVPILQVVEKDVPPKWRRVLELSLLVCLVILITPFLVFLGKSVIWPNASLAEIVQTQNEKIVTEWSKYQINDISRNIKELNSFLDEENYSMANGLIEKILAKDPNNSQVLALAERVRENIAQKEQIQAEIQEKALAKEREEKKRISDEIENLLKEASILTVEGNFPACVKTAQKVLKLDPHNTMAVTSQSFCNQALVESEQGGDVGHAHANENEKNRIEKSLKNILEKGKVAHKQKKYESALAIWSKAADIDPKKSSLVTKEINRRIGKLQKDISQWVNDYIDKGKKATEGKDYLSAILYYKTAHDMDSSNEKAKQCYETQLKENHALAEELYHEAIAYESLGKFKNAGEAIIMARRLASENKGLLELINKKISELEKMKS